MTITLAVAAALAVGYTVGRTRPIEALDNRVNPWIWEQARHPDAKKHPGWWIAQLYFLGFILIHPLEATRNRRENQRRRAAAAKPPAPAPSLDPNWAADRRQGEQVEQLARSLAGAAHINPHRTVPAWDDLTDTDRDTYRATAQRTLRGRDATTDEEQQ